MPSPQIVGVRGRRQLEPCRPIKRDQGRNVGNGKAPAGDERLVGQMSVHPLKKSENARSPALRQFRDLRVIGGARQGAAFEAGRRIPKRLHYGVETVPFGQPLPLGNNGLVLGALAKKPRLRLYIFEVLTNGDRISDPNAIVKLQNRHGRIGINRPECRAQMFAGAKVNLRCRYRYFLFAEEDADAPGAWGRGAVVELHLNHPQPSPRLVS